MPDNQDERQSGSAVSVVLYAADNHAELDRAIQEAEQALDGMRADYEILVVSEDCANRADRAADGNRMLGARASGRLPTHPGHVRWVHCRQASDYANALKTALAACRHALIVVARPALDLTALSYLVPLADRYPIVWAHRLARRRPSWKRVLAATAEAFLRPLVGTDVSDCGGGTMLSIFRRTALGELLPETEGPFAFAEVLARARQKSLAVVEAPVCTHSKRGRQATALGATGCGLSQTSLRWRAVVQSLIACLAFCWNRIQFPGPAPEPAPHPPPPLGGRARVAPSPFPSPWGRVRAGAGLGYGAWVSWLWGLLLLILAAVLLIPDNQPLLDPDEGRQAEIPREMMAHDDLLLPRMLGEPYYEKPPLQYWLTAAAYAVCGLRPWVARLVPAGAAWLTVLLTYIWGRRMLGARPAFLGGLSLCLSLGFVTLGRTVVLDSLLAACLVGSWYTAHAAVRRPGLRWGWWLASALACGLGMLAKGPVALVLLIPPVWVYQYLTATAARPRWLPWGAYVGLALAVAAPWYVWMAFRQPDYPEQFLWRANVVRFVSPFDHEQPWWFYPPILFVLTFPWSLLWPVLGYFLASRKPRLALLRPPGLGFCGLAVAWCLLFYSASGCKSPPYIAPAFAPLALLLGACIDALLFQAATSRDVYLGSARQHLPRRATAFMLLLSLGCYLTMALLDWQDWDQVVWPVAALVLAGVTWWRFGRRARPLVAWGACAAVTLAFLVLAARDLLAAYAGRHSPAAIARTARRWPDSAALPLVIYDRNWVSASFYLRRETVYFFSRERRQPMFDFLKTQPKALVLIESGPTLDEILSILPHSLEAEVRLPEREGQAALVVVHQRGQALLGP